MNHSIYNFSTHCFLGGETDRIRMRIGNDVWIGGNVATVNGISICDGAVIGAGSVVTKNIPPYAIAVGNPAKVIKYRFSKEQISRLLEIRWWDWPEDVILDSLDIISHDYLNDEIITEMEKINNKLYPKAFE